MSELYEKLSATSGRLIDSYGRPVTIVSVENIGSDFDPTYVETETEAIGVFSNYRRNSIDGTMIQADDKQLLVQTGIDINTGHIVRDGSIEYSIINIQRIEPGDTNIIYKLQIRR